MSENEQKTITHYACKPLSDETLRMLAEVLSSGQNIVELNLNGCELTDAQVKTLAGALKITTSLKTLYLGGNKIGGAGAQALAEALIINASLKTLYLNKNEIGDAGAQALAQMLTLNKTLQSLRLTRNIIGLEGAKAFAGALKVNRSLTEVFIWGNKFGNKGRKVLFEEGVKYNKTLIRYSDNSWTTNSAEVHAGSNRCKVNVLHQDIATFSQNMTKEQMEEILERLPAVLVAAEDYKNKVYAGYILSLVAKRAAELGMMLPPEWAREAQDSLPAPPSQRALPAPDEAPAEKPAPETKTEENLLPEDLGGPLTEGQRGVIAQAISGFLDVDDFLVEKAAYEDRELVRLFNRASRIHNERAAQVVRMEAEAQRNPDTTTTQGLLCSRKFEACNGSLERLAHSVMERARLKAQPG